MAEKAIEANNLNDYLTDKINSESFPITFQTKEPIALIDLVIKVTIIAKRQGLFKDLRVRTQSGKNTFTISSV